MKIWPGHHPLPRRLALLVGLLVTLQSVGAMAGDDPDTVMNAMLDAYRAMDGYCDEGRYYYGTGWVSFKRCVRADGAYIHYRGPGERDSGTHIKWFDGETVHTVLREGSPGQYRYADYRTRSPQVYDLPKGDNAILYHVIHRAVLGQGSPRSQLIHDDRVINDALSSARTVVLDGFMRGSDQLKWRLWIERSDNLIRRSKRVVIDNLSIDPELPDWKLAVTLPWHTRLAGSIGSFFSFKEHPLTFIALCAGLFTLAGIGAWPMARRHPAAYRNRRMAWMAVLALAGLAALITAALLLIGRQDPFFSVLAVLFLGGAALPLGLLGLAVVFLVGTHAVDAATHLIKRLKH